MGGDAAAGPGRPVDVAEGSHEGRLEGNDAAGEESWCVELYFQPLAFLGGVARRGAVITAAHPGSAYVPGAPTPEILKAHQANYFFD